MKPIKDNANYMLSILKNYYELKKKFSWKKDLNSMAEEVPNEFSL